MYPRNQNVLTFIQQFFPLSLSSKSDASRKQLSPLSDAHDTINNNQKKNLGFMLEKLIKAKLCNADQVSWVSLFNLSSISGVVFQPRHSQVWLKN